jgi:peptidoglycan-N-acetylglucosamine deacetylase
VLAKRHLSFLQTLIVTCLGVTISFLCYSCGSKPTVAPGVCISFDDRTIHEWSEMSHLFKRYDAKVTFFITQFDSLDKDEIELLTSLRNQGHEIGSHGALHVISEHYIKANGYKQYLADEVDSNTLAMTNAGFAPTSFAYPYGAKYWFTDYLLLKRFSAIRGVAANPKDGRLDQFDDIFVSAAADEFDAVSFDYGSDLAVKDLRRAMARATQNNEILMLYAHCPGSDESDPYTFDVSLLELILKEAYENKLRFYTVSEIAAL